MNILRQNTDYAMRMMWHLTCVYDDQAVSVRVLAESEEVSYQYACKILQSLHDADLVQSTMGPKGGYRLSREPGQIILLDIIKAMQGPINVNRCTDENDGCNRKAKCPVHNKLQKLQELLINELSTITLGDLL
jgi:Rrf2 family protein